MRNYRYAVERAMRALGGWIALTPELSAKLLMGRHFWDLAQQADAFGRRLPELRAHTQVSEPASERVVADRKSTRLNSSHGYISYAVFCLKKKNMRQQQREP